MAKRVGTLDSFLSGPVTKRHRAQNEQKERNDDAVASQHSTYPFALPHLPQNISDTLNLAPAEQGRLIDDQPHLDLVYYQSYVPKDIQRALFEFYRRELFFYRVKYTIKRGPVETKITTPRFTTVFGLDETSLFTDDGSIVDATTKKLVPSSAYTCKPRPIPQCLEYLRKLTENTTGKRYNFALVNYYATGNDSISYHSDDERFLGAEPAIASITLGAKRDFLMRHKKAAAGSICESKPLKLALASGDMVLMRGQTQAYWEHSIPKRKGPAADEGRVNITFRCAKVKGGTENYYRYNVGDGEPLRWDPDSRAMAPLGQG